MEVRDLIESCYWDYWMNGDCNLWICFDLFLKTLVFFLGGVCDGSPVLPATAGQWVWLGDSSRELCTPVLPSINLSGGPPL